MTSEYQHHNAQTMKPKRALLLTSNFPRWAGDTTTPFVLNLAVDLQALGWQIDVLAPHAPGAKRREVLEGVAVQRFRYMFPESQQTVTYGGGALINLRNSRANWVKVPFLVVAELLVTLRLLLTRRYALVNAHWILPQGFVATLAGTPTRTPVVTTVHGGDVFDLQGGLMSRFKRWSLRRAEVITVNSSATEAATMGLCTASVVRRIPMGVDTREPDPQHVESIRSRYRRDGGPLIVFVGRLVIEKGVDDLLRAIASVRRQLPGTTALVVGTGQDEASLLTLCNELGLSDVVEFTGWIQPEEIPSYLAAADVFAGPSKQSDTGWREGLGLVFLEAMAAGIPVVATASGGITDIVRDGETGLLVGEEAPGEIADAIVRLQQEPGLRAHCISNARQQVLTTFSRESSATAFAALFDEVARR